MNVIYLQQTHGGARDHLPARPRRPILGTPPHPPQNHPHSHAAVYDQSGEQDKPPQGEMHFKNLRTFSKIIIFWKSATRKKSNLGRILVLNILKYNHFYNCR